MHKTLRIIMITFAALLLIGALAVWIVNEPRPEAAPSAAADELARKMQAAIQIENWKNTRFVKWSFPGGHHYIWDKTKGLVQVRWADKEVLLRTSGPTGKVWQSRQPLQGEAAEAAIQEAWGYFCNDSFWLNAPAKAFDPGTARSLVETEDGSTALLVAYNSGGVTPGDAYLWHLDENYLPVAYEMWVSIIPIGGLKATWESWQTLPTGAKVATAHDLGIYKMEITGLSAGNRLSDIGLEVYPFEALGEYLRR